MQWILKLNARFQPIHRFELEDALQEIFQREGMGEVIGGGTVQNADGEIISCDIEFDLAENVSKNISRLVELLNVIGIPKGSILKGAEEIPIGTLEGLAYYSNGTELSDEVYQNCDINYVIEQMEAMMQGIGRMYSYWEGAQWTGLYFYGKSFDQMKQKIEPFISSYPLCQKSRIEQIA